MGAKLDERDLIILHLEAAGKPPRIIVAELAHLSVTYPVFYKARKKPLYAVELERVKREIHERLIAKSADLTAKFDLEAENSLNTVIKVRDGGEKDSDRLKAAVTILDRAPIAPKVVKNIASVDNRTIIQLPQRTVDNMTKALEDVGADNIIDLIAGEDFQDVTLQRIENNQLIPKSVEDYCAGA